MPADEKIYHVVHHIVERGLVLTSALWARYGLAQRPALQRAVVAAVARLREVGHAAGAGR